VRTGQSTFTWKTVVGGSTYVELSSSCDSVVKASLVSQELGRHLASGVAGPLAAWCGGQICRPIVLAFGKWIACLKPNVLMPKVTYSIYSILVSS